MTSSERRTRGRRRERHEQRPDNRRAALAAEAARIMDEQGLTDFRGAKTKALERLGLGRDAPLPTNEEIEAAVAERNRIFHGDSHDELVTSLRWAAHGMMLALEPFHPRLVGEVLSGNITRHSGVDLHLFSDTAEAVGESLDARAIPHRLVQRRLRLRRESVEPFPAYRFASGDFEFSGTVFPLRMRGHAPLNAVDGRPMQRGTLRDVEALLGIGGDAPTGSDANPSGR